jgi:hypothetical protein
LRHLQLPKHEFAATQPCPGVCSCYDMALLLLLLIADLLLLLQQQH